jgi:Protein of unknown function (DUF3551)
MRQSMMTVTALSALFAASGKAHAEVNYPWCLMGDTRGYECVFSSREQCMQDGRNRGFGSRCIKNPYYKPGAPTVSGPVKKRTVSQPTRPSQAVSAAQSTCTGLRSYCLSHIAGITPPSDTYDSATAAYFCNFDWEQCMKTEWWAGFAGTAGGGGLSRPAERR